MATSRVRLVALMLGGAACQSPATGAPPASAIMNPLRTVAATDVPREPDAGVADVVAHADVIVELACVPPLRVCNGRCVKDDPRSNPCGTCDRTCRLECPRGRCPTELNVLPGGDVNSLASDGSRLYWGGKEASGHGTLQRTPLTSSPQLGAVSTLATEPSDVIAVQTGGSNVYWASAGRIESVPLEAPGAPTTVVTREASVTSFAVDASMAYWTEEALGSPSGTGSVLAAPLAGGSVITLATGQRHPRNVLVSPATDVYWTTQHGGFRLPGTGLGAIMRTSLSRGAIQKVASDAQYYVIALDSTSLYWAGATYVGRRGDHGEDCTGNVMKVPLNGGKPTRLDDEHDDSSRCFAAIAVNSSHVYWSTHPVDGFDAELAQIPLTGGGVTKLATAALLSSTKFDPKAALLPLDGNIFWTAEDMASATVIMSTRTE